MSQDRGLLDQFRAASWSLSVLDPRTEMELGARLDPNSGFDSLAHKFGQDAQHLRLRAQGDHSVQNSPTRLLLRELKAVHGVTVQELQKELQNMGHSAADIIPNNLEALFSPLYRRVFYSSAAENTEESHCRCRNCQHTLMMCPSNRTRLPGTPVTHTQSLPPPYQQSFGPPPPFQPLTQSDTGNIQTPNFSHQLQRQAPVNSVQESCSQYSIRGGNTSHDGYELVNLKNGEGHDPHGSSLGCSLTGGESSHMSSRCSHLIGECPSPICDYCRLMSDPEETRPLKVESKPKTSCIACSVREGPIGSSEPDDINQIYNTVSSLALSDELFTSSGNVSDQRLCHKDKSRPQENSHRMEGFVMSGSKEKTQRKYCISSVNPHLLGDHPECKECKYYQEVLVAQNKTRVMPKERNTSRNRSQDPCKLRKSWPDKHLETLPQIKNSNSDSVLSVERWSPSSTECGRSTTNKLVENTLLTLSSMSSSSAPSSSSFLGEENYNNNLCLSSSSSSGQTNGQNRGSVAGAQSPELTYENNLNCDDNDGDISVNEPNIVVSDSFNCSRDCLNHRCTTNNSHRTPPPQKPTRSILSRQKTVFITYSWNRELDEPNIFEDVYSMCMAFRRAGIQVRLDLLDSEFQQITENKLDWIDTHVGQADFVVVCITPTYHKDVEVSNDASPRCTQLNARYIFDKIRQEFYHNQSLNRRVIPVMFTEYGTKLHHVPTCMRSTLIYEYPKHLSQIISWINGRGVYLPS